MNTVFFDLDGTLIPMSQDAFIEAYFGELTETFITLGLDAERSIHAVWSGTKAMLKNDGSVSNADRFWHEFSSFYGGLEGRLADIEEATDRFYINEFNRVQEVITPTDIPVKLISTLRSKGYTVVLATNPLFPPQAVASRLGWIGLTLADFDLHTDYQNARFCKPNLDYYRDIFTALKVEPEQCLMVGNTVLEDMCAAELGCGTYLVTDYLENPENSDYSMYNQGTLAEFAVWAEQLPQL